MSRMRWIVLVAVIAIGGTLAGQPQLGGMVAAVAFLVFVIVVALSSGSARTESGRKARSINYLARYRGDYGTPVVSAFAAWAVVDVAVSDHTLAVLAGALVFTLIALAALPTELAAGLFSIGGIAATVATLFQDDACRPATNQLSFKVMAGVLATFAGFNLATIIAASQISRVPKFLPRRFSFGKRAMLLFGLLDLALFVARPAGLEVWQDAPAWAMPAVLVLVGVIAIFGTYGAEIVLALLGVGMVVAHGSLAMVEHGLLSGTPTECGDPLLGLLWAGAACVLIMTVLIVKPSPTR